MTDEDLRAKLHATKAALELSHDCRKLQRQELLVARKELDEAGLTVARLVLEKQKLEAEFASYRNAVYDRLANPDAGD